MQEAYDENAPNPEVPKSAIGEPEYWEIGDQPQYGEALAQDYEFSEIVTLDKEEPKDNSKTNLMAAVLLILILGYLGFEYMETGKIPGQDFVMENLGLDFDLELESPAESIENNLTADKAAEKDLGDDQVADETDAEVVPGNPYWALPNEVVGEKSPVNRKWTPEEEEVFRSGLNHQYNWQRHKTIIEVRNKRLRGSEAILWDALGEQKFWARMHAAIGLSEFNIPLSISHVEEAIGDAHSQLVARFFKRFIKKSTAGARYMMRQAIKVLDDRGRLSVLRVLNKADDDLRDLYMVAATQDPSPRVQTWLRSALAAHPIEAEQFNSLLEVVNGSSTAELEQAESSLSEETDETNSELENDLVELENEEVGDIEFYEGEVEVDEAMEDENTEYDDY